eukprot:TRINITY_DN6469_c0_g2_i14.p1 TRINITY_DN6469_c0_g2~~TRINITY_DN6469_c0_g2_i14.p1  ORF type:complete len:348 (+),score=43.23 TRINITY_DN6469_c0_g2_i14:129-1172(+)
MMHYGHANALRQAKSLGDYLIVGVHSDADIFKNKGPPVMNEQERYAAVRACKWVDEVVEGAPYVTSLEFLDKYDCDFCVHGDDLVTDATGGDTYREVKAAGRFRTIPRTEGVSTTDIVGRMLLLTKDHQINYDEQHAIDKTPRTKVLTMSEGSQPRVSPYTRVSHFLPTSRRIVQFSNGKEPKPDDVVVYVNGSFDLFHQGHITLLREAKKLGTFLIVGIHPDNIINQLKGFGWPVMNLYERVLTVLSCRYVDEVIIGAPWQVTKDLIESQRIDLVAAGSVVDPAYTSSDDGMGYPKEIGIFRQFDSPHTTSTTDIVHRIITNRQVFVERNRKKEAKEISEMAATGR